MTANSLLKKLQLKGDQRAMIINPPQGYLDELGVWQGFLPETAI